MTLIKQPNYQIKTKTWIELKIPLDRDFLRKFLELNAFQDFEVLADLDGNYIFICEDALNPAKAIYIRMRKHGGKKEQTCDSELA